MTKTKKSNLSPKGSKNKTGYIIVTLLVILILVGLFFYKNKNIEFHGDTIYYTGDVYSANHAANMLDYLDNGKNIVISPINVNTSLAILYNGTDNNSNKEIKKYFKHTPKEVNEEMNNRLEKIKEEQPVINKFNKLYEKYIKELEDNSYTTLTVDTISLLQKEEKEQVLLLLRKIELTLDRINEKNNFKEKEIKEYVLTNNDLQYNNYTLKEQLDNILSEYEKYSVNNLVNNNTKIYIKDLKNHNINEEFINKTSFYNYKVEEEPIIEIQPRTISSIDETNKITINNNLEFNYSWENAFDRKNVNDAEFFDINNQVHAVEMMYSIETTYLENKVAKGFIYDFKNSKYSFIGILPKKTGNFKLSEINIDSLLLNKKKSKVLIGLPKMDYQSEIDIESLVSNYNIKEIFTNQANFSKISDDTIVIDTMIQKNNLTIAEKGTIKSSLKQTETSNITEEYDTQIILNRPYAYLIVNNETNDVMFIGKVVKINEGN